MDYVIEREVVYKFDFNKLKYYVFYNENNFDKYGNLRVYRLFFKGFVKKVMLDGVGNELGVFWMWY